MTETEATPVVRESERIPIWGEAWVTADGKWHVSIHGPWHVVSALSAMSRGRKAKWIETEGSRASEEAE